MTRKHQGGNQWVAMSRGGKLTQSLAIFRLLIYNIGTNENEVITMEIGHFYDKLSKINTGVLYERVRENQYRHKKCFCKKS